MYGAVGVEYTEQAEKRLEVRVLYTAISTVCIVYNMYCIVYNSILFNAYSSNIHTYTIRYSHTPTLATRTYLSAWPKLRYINTYYHRTYIP